MNVSAETQIFLLSCTEVSGNKCTLEGTYLAWLTPGCWAQESMAPTLRVLGAFLLCVVSELRTWYHSSHGPDQAGGWEEAQPHPIPPESFCSTCLRGPDQAPLLFTYRQSLPYCQPGKLMSQLRPRGPQDPAARGPLMGN